MPPTRSSLRKRQTQLSFSPLPVSSPGAASLSPQVRQRAAAVTFDGSPSRPSKKRKLVQLSDSDDEMGLPTPKKSFQSNEYTPNKREVERGMRLGMPASSSRQGMFGTSDNENYFSSDTSDVEEEQAPAPRRTERKKGPPPPPPESDSGESEKMPDTTPPRRARRLTNRRQRSNSFEVPDNEIEMEDSDEEAVPRRTQRRQPRRPDTESEEEESSDNVKKSGRRRSQQIDRKEQEDLEEDLEFLQSSPPSSSKGRLRSTQGKPMNERQKALAALKQRRAKTSSTGEPSSSATPGRNRAIVLEDSDSDSSLDMIKEEDEDADEPEEPEEELSDGIEDESDGEITSHKQNTNALDMFQEDANDADFIDDDPDAIIGEPAELTSMPLQFSSLSRAKPRELFKYAVEWMVQKKINPAFSSDDEIYELTFRKLNDEVASLANSKYTSSVWTADFTRALRARPDIMIDEIGRQMRDVMDSYCEACNRKSHPATFNISLTGKPYHKETLEPLGEDSDASSDSDSDISSASDDERESNGEKPTYDAQGERIPPESKVFTLGSTCKANAEVAHTLHHWRYHLNSWVVDYLVRTGHCTAEKLVERDKWSQKKRQKYANKIVDAMEKDGEIKKLHRLYRDQVDFALEARNEYKHGWGRR